MESGPGESPLMPSGMSVQIVWMEVLSVSFMECSDLSRP